MRHPEAEAGAGRGGFLGEYIHSANKHAPSPYAPPAGCGAPGLEPGLGRRRAAGETGNRVRDNGIHAVTVNKMLREHSGGPYRKVAW